MASERTSSGFGERLRDARERRGVTLRQIANATKISVGVLEALERNDISKLPGGIFGRAFVRAYAVEVGLDPGATIQEFIAQFPNDSVTAGHPTSDRMEDTLEIDSDRQAAGTFIWLIAIAVPIAAGLMYFATLGRRAETAPPSPAPPPPSAAAAPRAVAPRAVAPAPPDARPAVAAIAGDHLTVALTAKRPCWVSAIVDGQKAIERLLQTGEQQTVTVRREMVLTVGDASAIALQINGANARLLGRSGEVVTARFNLANYKDYLQGR